MLQRKNKMQMQRSGSDWECLSQQKTGTTTHTTAGEQSIENETVAGKQFKKQQTKVY